MNESQFFRALAKELDILTKRDLDRVNKEIQSGKLKGAALAAARYHKEKLEAILMSPF